MTPRFIHQEYLLLGGRFILFMHRYEASMMQLAKIPATASVLGAALKPKFTSVLRPAAANRGRLLSPLTIDGGRL